MTTRAPLQIQAYLRCTRMKDTVPPNSLTPPVLPPERSKLHQWLTKNKIFFETIAATCLAGAAITVAIVQATIANRQAGEAAKQVEIVTKQYALVDKQS